MNALSIENKDIALNCGEKTSKLLDSLGFKKSNNTESKEKVAFLDSETQNPVGNASVVFCLGMDSAQIKKLTGVDKATEKEKFSSSLSDFSFGMCDMILRV